MDKFDLFGENLFFEKSFSHKETLERDKKPIQLVTYKGQKGMGAGARFPEVKLDVLV